jgi:hypothetical protein
VRREYLPERFKIPESVSEQFSHELAEWLNPVEGNGNQESLYLCNTRLWLAGLSKKYGHSITIDKVPDKEWEPLLDKYDSFWFMGIYIPSEASRNHAKKYTNQYRYALPDLNPDKDVTASPFAISEYVPNPQIADSWISWDKMVDKLHNHGKEVFIDFVPNHTGLDHPWAKQHPTYYILGSEQQYRNNPDFFYKVTADDGIIYFIAHGKDPNYPEWADTLQLNYANPEVQDEMGNLMLKLIEHSDGIRCDMAMLLNPSTFIRTWGWILNDGQRDYIRSNHFWRKKIPLVREKAKKLKKNIDIAGEIYWDKDDLSQVFDHIYDNRLYELFVDVSSGRNISELKSYLEYLLRSADSDKRCRGWEYTENHDEERSANRLGRLSKTFTVLAGVIPGSVFLVNQGQEEGRKIRPPMQIGRFPDEAVDADTAKFFEDFFALKHTKLFQYGKVKMATISTRDPNIIAIEVRSPDNSFCAVICINPSNYVAECSIPEVDSRKNAIVVSLTDVRDIKPDQIRMNGIFVGLKPGEVQTVFFSNKSVEIKPAARSRHNLAFAS